MSRQSHPITGDGVPLGLSYGAHATRSVGVGRNDHGAGPAGRVDVGVQVDVLVGHQIDVPPGRGGSVQSQIGAVGPNSEVGGGLSSVNAFIYTGDVRDGQGARLILNVHIAAGTHPGKIVHVHQQRSTRAVVDIFGCGKSQARRGNASGIGNATVVIAVVVGSNDHVP